MRGARGRTREGSRPPTRRHAGVPFRIRRQSLRDGRWVASQDDGRENAAVVAASRRHPAVRLGGRHAPQVGVLPRSLRHSKATKERHVSPGHHPAGSRVQPGDRRGETVPRERRARARTRRRRPRASIATRRTTSTSPGRTRTRTRTRTMPPRRTTDGTTKTKTRRSGTRKTTPPTPRTTRSGTRRTTPRLTNFSTRWWTSCPTRSTSWARLVSPRSRSRNSTTRTFQPRRRLRARLRRGG